MSTGAKILFAVVTCIFYVPGYFFLFKEIGNEDFSLPSMIIGAFFTVFGLLGHSLILFEKHYEKLQKNIRKVYSIKIFFKIVGTSVLLSLGFLIIYACLFQQADNISEEDLTIFHGTLSKKPEFERGSKSSTYLNIYLKEFPEYTFEPRYDRYLHYNTNFEASCNIGDTIIVGIEKEDFDKNINRTSAKNFIERHVNQHLIIVYYLEKNGSVFYHPNIHNYLDKEDRKWGKFLWVLGLILILNTVSIWLTELVPIIRRSGLIKLADTLEHYRKKRIL